MKKLFKVLLWLAAIFFVMMLIFIGVLWWFTASLIDQKPFEFDVKVPDMQDSASAMRKVNIGEKLAAAMTEKPGGGRSDEMEKIELTENEVNALLVTGITMQMAAKGGDQEFRNAYFRDGMLTILLSKDMGFSTPFGKYLNITLSFVPGISNGHMSILPGRIAVGRLGVPEYVIKGRLSEEISAVEKTEVGQAVLSIVSELKMEKGKLTIVYSPRKLVQFIQEKGSMGAGGLLGAGLGSSLLLSE